MKSSHCPKYERKNYTWNNLNDNNIIIFDEVHFCKCKLTMNGKLLIASRNYKLLLLSATLIDDISSFEIFTYLLNWCKNLRKTKILILNNTDMFLLISIHYWLLL